MNDLRTLVRTSLDARSGDVPTGPPAWDRISAGLQAVRRRRRQRQASLVGALAVVAVAGAVLGGVTPAALRHADPATPDGPVRADAVFGGRTVGSLATDTAFLADLRREVVAAGPPGGGANPMYTRHADVLVPFAGDVGDLRIALLEVEIGRDDGIRNRFVWLTASKGAPAVDLARHAYSIADAGPVASLWLPTPTGEPAPGDAAPEGVGALVVLSARRPVGDLQLTTPPELTAEGRFRWPVQAVQPLSPGHWEAAVPWRLEDVTAGWWALPGAAAWSELVLPYLDASGAGFASGTAVHGGAPARGPAAMFALEAAQANARTSVVGSLRTLLWSGDVGGSTVSVVAVTVPGGAHVITVSRLEAGTGDASQPAVLVRPAGPVEKLCLATTTSDPRSGDRTGTFVLGPTGAVRAVVTGRAPLTLQGESGVAALADDGTPVTFLDAAGSAVCSTTVNGTSDTFEPHS